MKKAKKNGTATASAKGAAKSAKAAGAIKKPAAKRAAAAVVPALDAVPVDQLKATAAKAKASIAYVRGLFPKLSPMTDEERSGSSGHLGDEDEAAARAILAGKGEPSVVRERLERRAALMEVASQVQSLGEELSDTALRFGELVRPALKGQGKRAASDEAEAAE